MTLLDTSYHKRRLDERMRDPEFRREYEATQKQIAQVDAIVRELDDLRSAAGLSKAETRSSHWQRPCGGQAPL